MYTKQVIDLRGEIFEITPENRFHISRFLSGWDIDFKIVSNGSWSLWNRELIRVDKPPTAYFYNGKFWDRPQKTPTEIGKNLKTNIVAKLHEHIAQLEKQLSIKSLEVESLEVKLKQAYIKIGKLTIE